MREGDGCTPEGTYRVDARNPRSRFHLGPHISYPNESDRARAMAAGASPGSAMMIRGLPDSLAWVGKLGRFIDPSVHRLDGWVHRSDQSRDRGDLASGG